MSNSIINEDNSEYYKATKIILSKIHNNINDIWRIDNKININNRKYLQLCNNGNCEYIAKQINIKNKSEGYIKKLKKEYRKLPYFYQYLENSNEAVIIFKNPIFIDYNILDNLDNPITKKLLETFNSNILNDMDIFHKIKIYSEVLKDKNKNTLTKLIYNHFNNTKPVNEYIGGPFRVNHMYSKEYNMNIYLFGEYHSKNIDCPNDQYSLIENYLEQIVENTDVFLDMYFEFPGFSGNKYEKEYIKNDQRLIKLFDKFYNCIQTISRKSEKCQLSRIHYVDIRKILSLENKECDLCWFTNIYALLLKEERKKYMLDKNNKNRIQRILANLSSPSILTFIEEELTEYEYIKKELSKSYLGKNILLYMKEKIRDVAKEHIEFISEISQYMNYYLFKENKYVDKDFKDLFFSLTPIIAVMVDTYTLARMFKNFNVENIYEQPSRPHNIIYYAGYGHTEIIVEFLFSIGFKNIESINNIFNPKLDDLKYKNCIDLKKIKQPFFN